jgi:hypothetical protein
MSSAFTGNHTGPRQFDYLLIEALQKLDYFHGKSFTVECPTRSGQKRDLWGVAAELSRRLTRIFLRDGAGRRPVYGGTEKFQRDLPWKDHVLFYEYFHGDNGAGIGASHRLDGSGGQAAPAERRVMARGGDLSAMSSRAPGAPGGAGVRAAR